MQLFGLSPEQWQEIGVSVLILAAALMLGRQVINGLVLPLLKRLTRRTKNTLDDTLFDALSSPAYWLLIIIVLEFALRRLDFIPDLVQINLDEVYFVLYVMVAFVLFWRLISKLTDWYTVEFSSRTEGDLGQQLAPFASRVALILLIIIFGIILLGHFNVEVSGLVATLGIGSLAIALAAQETLSDTVSGFIIMFDRPYRIGDRIEVLDLDTWGDVMDIGLRSTRILTRDNRMVILPNSVIGKSLVVNHSYPNNDYRLQIEVGVGYGTDLEHARQVLIDAVKGVPGVMQDRPVEALFLQFGDSALIFRVRWWLDSYVETRRMFDKVNTAMYNALNDAGIEIPFPQRSLHHKIDADNLKNLGRLRGNT